MKRFLRWSGGKLILSVWLYFSALLIQDCGRDERKSPQNTAQNEARVDTTYTGKEAPMLAQLVTTGQLPPLTQRLPCNPKIIKPRQRLGNYCYRWRMVAVGIGDLSGLIGRIAYTSLVHWSMDWKSMEPGIAERWDISPDGRAFTFYLRRGIKFSDGHPFTAEDVAFAVQYIFTNKKLYPSPLTWMVQNGQWPEFAVLDRYTFRFTYPQPNGAFLMNIAAESGILFTPKHYLKKFLPPFVSEAQADSQAMAQGFSKWNAYFTTVVASPYQNPDLPVLMPWRRTTPRGTAETQWVFARNPYYYAIDTAGRQLPYFDSLVVSNVSELEQLYLKAMTGEIDYQDRNIEGTRAQLLLKNQKRGNYRVAFYPTDWLIGLFFNQTQEGDSIQRVLNGTRAFRLALSLAINRKEMHQLLNWGAGPDLSSFLFPNGSQPDPEILEWFKFDVKRANHLLDSLGLVRGPDGERLRPDQKKLVLTVYIIEFLPIDFLELVSEYWQEIGVKLLIKKMSYRSWWDFVNSFKFSLISYYIYLPPQRILLLFPHHVIPYHAGTYWGGKWGLWFSSEGQAGEAPPASVRDLFRRWDQIMHEMDETKQLELLRELRIQSLKMGHTLILKTQLPKINILKNNFYNVSEGYFRECWPLRGPAPDFPDTYFIR